MSRFTVIDLSQLPGMVVLEDVDSEAILSRRMTRFVELWNEHDPPVAAQYDVANLEFDPVKIVEECDTDSEMKLRDRINQAARAVTLAYAISGDLDAIASRYPGGVPRLTDANGVPNESDDHYRKRIWLSVNPLSPHGTAEAYQFWALTALGEDVLRDVSVIKIRPLLQDNPIIVISCLASGPEPRPTTEQLLQVRRYIQSEWRQGFTDVISVNPPKVKDIEYYLRVWFFPGPAVNLLLGQIRDSILALLEKQYWLGYDHTLGALYAAANQPGVSRITVLEPTGDILIPYDWVGRVTSVKIEYMGRAE